MRLSLSIIIFLGYLIKPQTGFEIAKMIDEKPVPRSLSNKIEMVMKNSKGKTRKKMIISKIFVKAFTFYHECFVYKEK